MTGPVTDVPAALAAADFEGLSVLVAGAGTAGSSAARHLLSVGALVTVADDRFASDRAGEPAGAGLAADGARCVPVDAVVAGDAGEFDLMVASPGFSPRHPLIEHVRAAGVPVWGEVELAWHIDRCERLGPSRIWLVVTGTNGKTTTTSMLAEIVEAAGMSGAACGNIGLPVLDAMRSQPRADVLCVEASSFQLHWAPSIRPAAGVVLNIAEDHLDWHGSLEAYAQAKAVVLGGAVGVLGRDDVGAAGLTVPAGTTQVGFTAGVPETGELGVIDGELVDRAFSGPVGLGSVPTRRLLPTSDIRPAGPSGLADASAAAALALAVGIEPAAVAQGLRSFSPAGHRGEVVETIDGVVYIDDSKATNPHAARAAIAGRSRVVLIAGGLLKGASVDELFGETRDRLAGVVAIGADRGLIVDAISRHAPEVPTVTVFTGDDGAVNVHRVAFDDRATEKIRVADPGPVDGRAADSGSSSADAVMLEAVVEARRMATSDPTTDAVLLAPAAASLDMFPGYGRRGDSFAEAAHQLALGSSGPARR